MKYYGYIRVSTPTQVENGQGLSTQRNEIEKLAVAQNLAISGFFSDEGISGTTADRDGLNELLSCLEKGDKIIVANTSRLWRSDTAKVMIHHELKKIGVDVISVDQPNYSIYATDPNDFLFNGMMELLDQYDRMLIVRRLAKGRKTKARNGSKACGSAPFGYRWEDAKIVIDYNNNLIVQDIFDSYLRLGSLGKLQTYCKEREYKTANGKDFSKQSLSNILSNDFYTGIVTHAGVKSRGDHEPIIDVNIFHEVQSRIKR